MAGLGFISSCPQKAWLWAGLPGLVSGATALGCLWPALVAAVALAAVALDALLLYKTSVCICRRVKVSHIALHWPTARAPMLAGTVQVTHPSTPHLADTTSSAHPTPPSLPPICGHDDSCLAGLTVLQSMAS